MFIENKLTREDVFIKLGLRDYNYGVSFGNYLCSSSDNKIVSLNPTTGEILGTVYGGDVSEYNRLFVWVEDAAKCWRKTPAPTRAALIRDIAEELRVHKNELGVLIALEEGKLLSEGIGEIEEVINIADYAVGLSRTLSGNTVQSERSEHRSFEKWSPLGVVGIITAFNFPIAVWGWNAMIAVVCGNAVIWKPSSETPLCAVAIQQICNRVMKKHGVANIFNLIIGKREEVGESLINDNRVSLISFTGSCSAGSHIAQKVAKRIGQSLLELGGNNAVIVMDDADINLALKAVLFGAIGTAGQRCTTTRRLLLHEKIAVKFTDALTKAYEQIKIGDPLNENTHMGPLINKKAVDNMMEALEKVRSQSGEIIYGGKRLHGKGFFVEPVLVHSHNSMPIMKEETFAPILYILKFSVLEEAISMNNSVPQGLSSSIFTQNLRNAEIFLSDTGSDCGIVNVNTGTSGAEVGMSFGGNKATGWGREAGGDAWKNYMKLHSCTINYSGGLELAQGIKFKV